MLFHHGEGLLSIMDKDDKLVAKGLFCIFLSNIGIEEHCCSVVNTKFTDMGSH